MSSRRRLLAASTFVAASAQLVGFLLPLFAGASLHARPAALGALEATQAVGSLSARLLIVRPLDRALRAGDGAPAAAGRRPVRDAATVRRWLGRGGALLGALGCLGFAAADRLVWVFLAAVLTGLGLATFTTVVRGELAGGDLPRSRAYARLLAYQSRGALVGFVVGLALVSTGGYRLLFLATAASYLAAALAYPSPQLPAASAQPPVGSSAAGVRLSSILTIAAVTSAVEAGLGLVILIHLQRVYGLEPAHIAVLLAPAFLAFVVLPEPLSGLVYLLGRGPSLVGAVVVLTGGAIGLAFADSPHAIAGAWFGISVCLAGFVPLEQSMLVRMSGARQARGLSLYGGVNRVGAALGPAVIAALYGAGGWRVACVAGAATAAVAFVAIPATLTRHRAALAAARADEEAATATGAGQPATATGDGQPATAVADPVRAVPDGDPA